MADRTDPISALNSFADFQRLISSSRQSRFQQSAEFLAVYQIPRATTACGGRLAGGVFGYVPL